MWLLVIKTNFLQKLLFISVLILFLTNILTASSGNKKHARHNKSLNSNKRRHRAANPLHGDEERFGRVRKSGPNPDGYMPYMGVPFQHMNRKPNIILILTDDQDVELGKLKLWIYNRHIDINCIHWISRISEFHATHHETSQRWWGRIPACLHVDADVLPSSIISTNRSLRTQSYGVHEQWQLLESIMASDTRDQIIRNIPFECRLSYRLFRKISEQVQWLIYSTRVARMGWLNHELQVLQLQYKYERTKD